MIKDIGTALLIDRKLYKVFLKLAHVAIFFAIFWLLYLPNQSQSNDIEENALNPALMSQEKSNQMSQKTELLLNQLKDEDDIQSFILNRLKLRGLQVYEQKYKLQHENGQVEGSNLIGLLHTKRSPGFECNIFTYEFSNDKQKGKQRNVALILSFINMLQNSEINYLSRDILFVGYQSEFREYGKGIRQFLEEYYHPKGVSQLPRCGAIREAIDINLDDDFNQIILKLIGLNGRVPDRDFFLNINDLLIKADVDFTYQEYNWEELNPVQNFMEEKMRYIWNLFSLEQFYSLPGKKVFNFKTFFSMLRNCIQGDIHEQHSYLFKYGIHAVTLRGIFNHQIPNKKNQSYLTALISRVIEGANRAYMALDEHLHAASTMYIPTQKKTSITIQKYVWPIAIVGVSIAVMTLKWLFIDALLEKDQEKRRKAFYNAQMTWLKSALLFTACLLSVVAPNIAEKIHGQNIKFCQLRDTEDQLNSLFHIYIYVVVGIIGSTYFIINPLVSKYFFGRFTLERKYVSMIFLSTQTFLIAALGMIYCLILNISTAYIIAIFIAPWYYFIQPLIPCMKKYNLQSLILYVLNVAIVLAYAFLIYSYFSLEYIMETWKQLVVNYSCSETHLFYYLHLIGFYAAIGIANILLF